MKQKLITLRIDNSDFKLLKQTQENLKITSLNTVIKDLLFNSYSMVELHDKSIEFLNNNQLKYISNEKVG